VPLCSPSCRVFSTKRDDGAAPSVLLFNGKVGEEGRGGGGERSSANVFGRENGDAISRLLMALDVVADGVSDCDDINAAVRSPAERGTLEHWISMGMLRRG